MTRDEAVERALAMDPLGGDALTVLAVEAGDVADLLLEVAAQARREALEEAARVCGARAHAYARSDRRQSAAYCADAIRRLAEDS